MSHSDDLNFILAHLEHSEEVSGEELRRRLLGMNPRRFKQLLEAAKGVAVMRNLGQDISIRLVKPPLLPRRFSEARSGTRVIVARAQPRNRGHRIFT